uniref:Skp1_POZ domain-containing protein n=1 Tax=Rhabditophanes sp. KR3021 TaxID=114890 RepID=A0AC35UDM5_9BILA
MSRESIPVLSSDEVEMDLPYCVVEASLTLSEIVKGLTNDEDESQVIERITINECSSEVLEAVTKFVQNYSELKPFDENTTDEEFDSRDKVMKSFVKKYLTDVNDFFYELCDGAEYLQMEQLSTILNLYKNPEETE